MFFVVCQSCTSQRPFSAQRCDLPVFFSGGFITATVGNLPERRRNISKYVRFNLVSGHTVLSCACSCLVCLYVYVQGLQRPFQTCRSRMLFFYTIRRTIADFREGIQYLVSFLFETPYAYRNNLLLLDCDFKSNLLLPKNLGWSVDFGGRINVCKCIPFFLISSLSVRFRPFVAMHEHIYNSHYGNGKPAMFTFQCCPTER